DTPLRASLIERGRRLAATPLLASTIDDHLHGLAGEDVPQVCVPRRFLAPHYDQQTSHTPSPVDHQPKTVNRRPSTEHSVHGLSRGSEGFPEIGQNMQNVVGMSSSAGGVVRGVRRGQALGNLV